MSYIEKSFNIPTNTGLSETQITLHLGLYAGYVKNTNLLLDKINTLKSGEDSVSVSELQRRLGFEFDGMRLHEYYFSQLSEGYNSLDMTSKLGQLIQAQFGSFDSYIADLKRLASMRGIGWVITYYDAENNSLINAWVADHELGHLAGLPIVFVIDLWEHAFMVDYAPATKADYIETYLNAINWEVVASRI
jgi:Fe-Mn family superoxide dismutase